MHDLTHHEPTNRGAARSQDHPRLKNPELWRRIAACHPDDAGEDAAFPFSARLARDNGWSRPFARRVIVEYQRFCYLAMLGEGLVTPSDEVDQAWHLHLTYTEHYWGPFAAALGRPLHHGPTKGGADQDALFHETYEATRALYAREFGPPPTDIWPPPETRFGKAPHFKRINTDDVFVVPKPRLTPAAAAVGTAALGLGIGLLLSTEAALAHNAPRGDTALEQVRNLLLHWAFDHTFWFGVGFVCAFVFLAAVFRGLGGKGGKGGGGCAGGGPSDGVGSGDGGSGCSSSGCGGCGGG